MSGDERDHIIGRCPFLQTPCVVYCGFHVEGMCSWLLPPSQTVELSGARIADPREWYAETLASIGR